MSLRHKNSKMRISPLPYGLLMAFSLLLIGRVSPCGASVLAYWSGEQAPYTVTGPYYNGLVTQDELTGDGAQDAALSGVTRVTTPSQVKFGAGAYAFGGTSRDALRPDQADGTVDNSSNIADPNNSGIYYLGTSFTLSAQFATSDTVNFQALFATSDGTPTATSEIELLLDPDQTLGAGKTLRLAIKGAYIYSNSSTPTITDNGYHHAAVTYDDGLVNLYLDGALVGSGGSAGGGAITLKYPGLWFGDRYAGTSYAFKGYADDLLVYNQALGAGAISFIANNGAESWLSIPEPTSMNLIVIGFASLLFLRRRFQPNRWF